MVHDKIKKLLEERARKKEKINVTIDGDKVHELRELAKYHKLPFSVIVQMCIEVGLVDPYINPKNKEERDLKDDLY